MARFFVAVESGDRRALAELVPDPALRARLPQALVPEPACDAANAESPGTVVVAATEERGDEGKEATKTRFFLLGDHPPHEPLVALVEPRSARVASGRRGPRATMTRPS